MLWFLGLPPMIHSPVQSLSEVRRDGTDKTVNWRSRSYGSYGSIHLCMVPHSRQSGPEQLRVHMKVKGWTGWTHIVEFPMISIEALEEAEELCRALAASLERRNGEEGLVARRGQLGLGFTKRWISQDFIQFFRALQHFSTCSNYL